MPWEILALDCGQQLDMEQVLFWSPLLWLLPTCRVPQPTRLRCAYLCCCSAVPSLGVWTLIPCDSTADSLIGGQVANPRVFKSHESFADVPKGGKYIYVARDPLDAFVSFYKFLPAYMGIQ